MTHRVASAKHAHIMLLCLHHYSSLILQHLKTPRKLSFNLFTYINFRELVHLTDILNAYSPVGSDYTSVFYYSEHCYIT